MSHCPTRDTGQRSAASQGTLQFTLSPQFIAFVFSAMVLLFVLAHLVFAINYHILGYDFFGATMLYVLFDLHGEVTIPTWYSSSLLLCGSLLLAGIAVAKKRLGDPYRLHWAGLSLTLLALSIDEAADLHGAISYKLQAVLNTSGLLAYAWVIPGAALTLMVGLLYTRFLFHLPSTIRRQFLLAGSLFVGGALVIEIVEAGYESASGTSDTIAYLVMVAMEEAMEMGGVIVLISALLSYLRSFANAVHIEIVAG